MISQFFEWIFWISTLTAVYCYLGLPALAVIQARICKHFSLESNKTADSHDALPPISICIAAYNEENNIRHKLQNIFESDYPRERIEVIVGSDGSSDRTEKIVEEFKAKHNDRIVLLSLPRAGKNSALNRIVEAATHHVLVFTDADVLLKKNALKQLVYPLSNADTGCVAGDFHYQDTMPDDANDGERGYWRLERAIKRLQSRAGSITSATGQLYALRKHCFTDIPPGVTDDFFASVQAVRHKMRIVFQPLARCYGTGLKSTDKEFARKVRTLTAGLKGVWAVRDLCNPFKYRFYAVQLFTHKVARRLAAIPIVAQFIALFFIADVSPWYLGWLIVQILIHLLALIGYICRRKRFAQKKIFVVPFFIDMVLVSVFVALINIILNQRHDLWAPQRDCA